MNDNGQFVISLDFELMWGVFDKRTIPSYGKNILGAREVIPKILALFHEYNIAGTWASVGFLFHDQLIDAKKNLPSNYPNYENNKLSAWDHLNSIDENNEHYYFAHSLLTNISKTQRQEIASHTYSHYYCLEPGQNLQDFRNDTKLMKDITLKNDIAVSSIVFPRNQYNSDYLKICSEIGLSAFRGNQTSWLYKPLNQGDENKFRRLIRLIDSYLNLSGHHCALPQVIGDTKIVNIPASSFLRPYNSKLFFLESLKLKRIKKAMTYAAKNKLVYHLWWHPHNFGVNQEENLKLLEKILLHFRKLNDIYNFQSSSMNEIAKKYK